MTPLDMSEGQSSDATTWNVTYDHHSDSCRGVINNRNIFIIRATRASLLNRPLFELGS